MSLEEWRAVIGYDNYLISSLGRVMNTKRGRILKVSLDTDGYKQIGLHKEGIRVSFKIHRLIAIEFIPNPENKACVDHIDRCITNNSISNLRWTTHIENMQNRAVRDLPLHIHHYKNGYRAQFRRNKVWYRKKFKELSDAILWKEATLSSLNQNQNHL